MVYEILRNLIIITVLNMHVAISYAHTIETEKNSVKSDKRPFNLRKTQYVFCRSRDVVKRLGVVDR